MNFKVTCVYRTPLKLKQHIKPHKFVFKLDEPLPAEKNIEEMLRIKNRGADVVFREPL